MNKNKKVREKLIRRIASKRLLSEIDDIINTAIIDGWETQYDIYTAFKWICDNINNHEYKHLKNDCRQVLFALKKLG